MKNIESGKRECAQCGKCCLGPGSGAGLGSVYASEVEKLGWENRPDIMRWLGDIGYGLYDLWVSPNTGMETERCPWLRKLPNKEKYICRINDVKPCVCNEYTCDYMDGKSDVPGSEIVI